jgi:hypothetical protein
MHFVPEMSVNERIIPNRHTTDDDAMTDNSTVIVPDTPYIVGRRPVCAGSEAPRGAVAGGLTGLEFQAKGRHCRPKAREGREDDLSRPHRVPVVHIKPGRAADNLKFSIQCHDFRVYAGAKARASRTVTLLHTLAR